MRKRKKIRLKIRTEIVLDLEPTEKNMYEKTLYDKTSDEVREIINHWNSLKGVQTHLTKGDTKTMKLSIKQLEKLLKKEEPEKIKFAMTLYNNFLCRGLLRHKYTPSLPFFLSGNKYLKQKAWYPIFKDKNKMRKLYRSVADREFRNKVRDILKYQYARHVLNKRGKEDKVKYSKKENEQFELSAEKLIKFVREEKRSMPYMVQNPTVEDFVRFLFAALRWFYKGHSIYVGNLCSQYTFNRVLPLYLDAHKRPN